MGKSLKMSQSNSFRLGAARFCIYVILVFLAIVAIVPIWLLIVNGTRSTRQIQAGVSLIPGTSMIDNWNHWNGKNFSIGRGYLNSFIISGSSTILTVYFSMLTAYAVEVYNFAFKDFFRRFIYILVLIPAGVSSIGFYQLMSRLELTDNYIPLIFPGIAAAGSVFFCEQYLKTALVKDLIYSARIDGCSEFGIFHKIMMPMAKPGIYTLSIFSFVASWNNFMIPFMILNDTDLYTIPLLTKLLRADAYRTNFGAVYLALMLSILPVIVVYVLLSRQIVGGLTLGAVKE